MKKFILDSKNVVIMTLLVAILIMAVGYATFAQQVTINGNAEIKGEWTVEITNIEATSVIGTANAGDPTFTKTTANFDAQFEKPGDAVVYTVTIENKGNIDAKLSTATFTPEENGSQDIIYTHSEPSATLSAGSSTTFTITATYDASSTEIPEVKTRSLLSVVEYVQAE